MSRTIAYLDEGLEHLHALRDALLDLLVVTRHVEGDAQQVVVHALEEIVGALENVTSARSDLKVTPAPAPVPTAAAAPPRRAARPSKAAPRPRPAARPVTPPGASVEKLYAALKGAPGPLTPRELREVTGLTEGQSRGAFLRLHAEGKAFKRGERADARWALSEEAFE